MFRKIEGLMERFIPKREVTAELAKNVVRLKYGDIPSDVIGIAKRGILDAAGCMLAGALQPSSRKVLQYVRGLGGAREATCVYYGDRTNMFNATIANGAFCHALEFDDFSGPGLGCEAVVIPAVLAAAGKRMANGNEVITAVVMGWEIMCRIAAAVTTVPLSRPLHPISTFGPFGAAVASGKIFSFDDFEMENAITCCPAQAAGTLHSTQCESGRLIPGFAASYGLRAATMAQKGISGARGMLEGKAGFFMCVAGLRDDGNPIFDADKVNDGFGSEWRMRDATFKKYPTEADQLSVIGLVEDLRNEKNIRPEEIAEVTIDLDSCKMGLTKTQIPMNGDLLEAQYSMVWGVAMALILGQSSIRAYLNNLPPYGKSSDIVELAAKVKIINDEHGNRRESFPKVEIKFQDGQVVRGEGKWPRGNHLHNPMTVGELEEKFRDQAMFAGIATGKQDRVIEAVNNLEDQDDIDVILSNLVL